MERAYILATAILTAACAGPVRADSDSPVIAQHGMVVTAEAGATHVGVDILEQGGNAFDAAAAVGFALAVTYPAAGNIGGGGFCVGLKADGSTFALDFREKAPSAASRDMYLDDAGNFVKGMSTDTHLAVGVPGTTAGLLLLLEEHGTMERDDVLAPAIRLAREGFPLNRGPSDRLKKNPAAKALFFPEGEPLKVGDILVQPDLANTLTAISEQGRDGFYQGPVAKLLAEEMERHGGLITLEALRDYTPETRRPFSFKDGARRLICMPPPSSGGVTIAQILGLLDLDQLRAAGHQTTEYIHMLTEAERLAYADRNYFLGDPQYMEVESARLISDSYLQERRNLMPKGRAGKREGISHGQPESEETTHFTIVDRWGNVVAITYTLNSSFGSGILVEGAGFFLNNEMDNFSAKPGVPNNYGLIGAAANAIAPGKRMLSSMTPTIVLQDGEFAFTMGTPGGSTIITSVLQIYLNITLFGMSMTEAIDAPRVHHQWLPDLIQPETGAFSDEVVEELNAMGYEIKDRRSIGRAAGIMRLEDGRLEGKTDRRARGLALGH